MKANWILASLLLLALANTQAWADDYENADLDNDFDSAADDLPDMEEPSAVVLRSFSRAIFPGSASSHFPDITVGQPVESLISFLNVAEDRSYTMILAAGYITLRGSPQQIIQNFSVVRHARDVRPAETASVQYTFTTNPMLVPDEYDLVLGVYCHDGSTNSTFFSTAFNGTVLVKEESGVDYKAISTYLVVLAVVAGAAYWGADKMGLVGLVRSTGEARSPKPQRRTVEVGTSGAGYDPDYIGKDHIRYVESLRRRSS